jgi:hypothetical protein
MLKSLSNLDTNIVLFDITNSSRNDFTHSKDPNVQKTGNDAFFKLLKQKVEKSHENFIKIVMEKKKEYYDLVDLYGASKMELIKRPSLSINLKLLTVDSIAKTKNNDFNKETLTCMQSYLRLESEHYTQKIQDSKTHFRFVSTFCN